MTHRCMDCSSDNCSCAAECYKTGKHSWGDWLNIYEEKKVCRRCFHCGDIDTKKMKSTTYKGWVDRQIRKANRLREEQIMNAEKTYSETIKGLLR